MKHLQAERRMALAMFVAETKNGAYVARMDFLSRVADLMGWPSARAEDLTEVGGFTGPAGLPCRLHLRQDGLEGEEVGVRLEVLLPLSAAELTGDGVERLRSIQTLVLDELGWYLGVAEEGGVQLMSLRWIEDPAEAVAALGLANAMAQHVLRFMVAGDREAEALLRLH